MIFLLVVALVIVDVASADLEEAFGKFGGKSKFRGLFGGPVSASTSSKCVYDNDLGHAAEDLQVVGQNKDYQCREACRVNKKCDFWIHLGPNGWKPNGCWLKKFVNGQKSLGDVNKHALSGAVGGVRECKFRSEESDVEESDEEEFLSNYNISPEEVESAIANAQNEKEVHAIFASSIIAAKLAAKFGAKVLGKFAVKKVLPFLIKKFPKMKKKGLKKLLKAWEDAEKDPKTWGVKAKKNRKVPCIYGKDTRTTANNLKKMGQLRDTECRKACSNNKECDFWISSRNGRNGCWLKKFLKGQKSLGVVRKKRKSGAIGGVTGCKLRVEMSDEELMNEMEVSDEEEFRNMLLKLMQ